MNGFTLNTVNGIYIGNQLASAVYLGNNLIWQSHDYSQDWFTIEAIDNCDITFTVTEMEFIYSIGDAKTEGWTGTVNSSDNVISLSSGEITCLGGRYDKNNYTNPIGTINSTGRIKVYGNIMSLLDADKSDGNYGETEYANFKDLTDLTGYPSNIFKNLFENCTNLIDASNLILPVTTLTNYCYSKMFFGCTSLTTAPKLPATTLTQGCYGQMFSGCTSLIKAPKLPATTLAMQCYANMFYNCSLLTKAPDLPATILAVQCYVNMFKNCTSLNYIKCLATADNAAFSYWVSGVAASGTFIKSSEATFWPTGVSGIPSGWTVQEV